MQIRQRLKGEVRVDRPSAITDQQAEMMHLARLAGLDDQAGLRARAFADQVMVHRRRRQQTRDRDIVRVHAAVRQQHDRSAILHRLRGFGAQIINRPLQSRRPIGSLEQHRQRHGFHLAHRHLPDLLQIRVRQDRRLDLDQVAMLRRLVEQVPLAAEIGVKRCDQRLKVRIERRIGHLREELLEIAVQQLRPIAQTRQRRISPHRADRLRARHRHRQHQHLQIFHRVPERVLADQQRIVIRLMHISRPGQAVDVDQVLFQPFLPGPLRDQVVLDLAIIDDPALLHVHQEDLARLKPPLLRDLLWLDR